MRLDYVMARYYDSRTGTFCSADSLAGDPSDPQSWNRYPYGRNDPIDVTDPSGKSWLSRALFFDDIFVTGFAPEIDPFLDGLFGGGGASASTANITWPVLRVRDAAAVSDLAAGAGDAAAASGGLSGLGGAALTAAAAQATDQPKKQTNPYGAALLPAQFNPKKPCPPSGAFSLDYSQPLYNGGTQTTEGHITQQHIGAGLPGVSKYFGNFWQVKNINAMTYLFGNQSLQGNSVVFQYAYPQLPWLKAAGVQIHIGQDANGVHTNDNRLVTKTDCKTVVSRIPSEEELGYANKGDSDFLGCRCIRCGFASSWIKRDFWGKD